MENLTFVDEEGVPRLVQHMERSGKYTCRVRYFDGRRESVMISMDFPRRPNPCLYPEPEDWQRLREYKMHCGWWWALAEEEAKKRWKA